MYTRLVNAASRKQGPPGVVVSGQPGIGKSYFAVYVLLRRMADRQPTPFNTTDGTTFLFDESGVRETLSSTIRGFKVYDMLGLDECERCIWSLIDPGRTELIADSLTNPAFFYAVFASPNETRYKHLLDKDGGPLWIMSPWESSELLRLIKIGGIPDADPTKYTDEDAVQQLYSLCGPCPRAICSFLKDPASYEEEVAGEIRGLDTVQKISKLFNNPLWLDKFSTKLILVSRVGPIDVNSSLSDRCFVDVQTASIYTLLVARIAQLSVEEAKALLWRCGTLGPGAASFPGLVFEALAIHYMCGAAPATDDVFCGFVPMTAVPGAAPHAFSYKPEKATATLAVNDRALTLSQEVDSSPPNPAATLSALCPTKYLTQVRYAKVADIADIMKGIFVPGQASNDALFNAFYVEEEKDECSVVWIFRVTVGQGHGGAPSRSGFATVEEIREKVETARPGKRVELKYVLVVPFEEKWALRWNMADGFSNVEGEVYLQFLRVKALHADVARELIVGN